MCDYCKNYLASTGNRDKVMAIVQFLPMALAGPTEKAGCPSLASSLSNLSKMADAYRAVTRLGLLLDALSSQTLKGLMKPQGDVFVERLQQVGHFFHVLFCIFDNNALLAGSGVTNPALTRLGGCAVTCWFYVLLTGFIREAYKMATKTLSDEEYKHSIFTLVKLGSFMIFAMGSLPKAGPQLLEGSSCGVLMPIHSGLRMIAPPVLNLSDSTRGLFGLISSICDFF